MIYLPFLSNGMDSLGRTRVINFFCCNASRQHMHTNKQASTVVENRERKEEFQQMAYGRLVLQLLPFALLFASSLCVSPTGAPERKTIEVSIGVGNAPPPSEFLNDKQYRAYLVIQQFKTSITCDPGGVTDSWVGPRPCDYQGFHCGAPEDSPDEPTVAAVDLNGYNLSAPTVTGFLDQLPDLAFFHSNSNNFSGPIPDLSGLRYLRELDVSSSAHTGAFPAAVLSLPNLIFLDVRFNLFAGAVPASVFSLGLDVLFLNNNNLNQRLPAAIGSSPVAYLTLANNGFTGPIPRSISKASKTLIEVPSNHNNLQLVAELFPLFEGDFISIKP